MQWKPFSLVLCPSSFQLFILFPLRHSCAFRFTFAHHHSADHSAFFTRFHFISFRSASVDDSRQALCGYFYSEHRRRITRSTLSITQGSSDSLLFGFAGAASLRFGSHSNICIVCALMSNQWFEAIEHTHTHTAY